MPSRSQQHPRSRCISAPPPLRAQIRAENLWAAESTQPQSTDSANARAMKNEPKRFLIRQILCEPKSKRLHFCVREERRPKLSEVS